MIDSAKINRIADCVDKLSARFDAMADSDAGAKPRMYGSYTTSQLKGFVANGDDPPETIAKMKTEIAARESGASKVNVTPQIQGGKPNPKVGRL